MSRRRRRRQLESVESHDRWLVSYADFITLLFAFFTTLYAISVIDHEKGERFVYSIREFFGHMVFEAGKSDPGIFDQETAEPIVLGSEPGGLDPVEIERVRFEALEMHGRELSRKLEGGGMSVRRSEEGLIISLADSRFFAAGASELDDASSAAILRVAELLQNVPNHIRIEGHTDDSPVSTNAFPSNWHLSAARGAKLAQELEAAGIPAHRLSASGFADQRPLVSNGTLEGRRLNRRVDIVILRTKLSADDT